MATKEQYRQCRLVKRIPGGESIQMSWIPAEFALVGKIVKLREDDGAWDDGWVIREVGNPLEGQTLTKMNEWHHRFQRETTKQ